MKQKLNTLPSPVMMLSWYCCWLRRTSRICMNCAVSVRIHRRTDLRVFGHWCHQYGRDQMKPEYSAHPVCFAAIERSPAKDESTTKLMRVFPYLPCFFRSETVQWSEYFHASCLWWSCLGHKSENKYQNIAKTKQLFVYRWLMLISNWFDPIPCIYEGYLRISCPTLPFESLYRCLEADDSKGESDNYGHRHSSIRSDAYRLPDTFNNVSKWVETEFQLDRSGLVQALSY